MGVLKRTVFSMISIVCVTGAAHAQQQKQGEALEKIWETAAVFGAPEAVVFDEARNVLYVSNFNVRGGFVAAGDNSADEFISQVGLRGEIINLKWVQGLLNPCGLAVYRNRLYAVERTSLAEIGIPSGKILVRYPLPGAKFPNDIAFDSSGTGYVTDNDEAASVAIYRFRDGRVSPWVTSDKVYRPNGICVEGDRVIVGDMRDFTLKSVSVKDGTVTLFASLAKPTGARPFTIDGLTSDGRGNILASYFYQDAYLISGRGELLSVIAAQEFVSNSGRLRSRTDVAYVQKENLLVVPTLLDNSLYAYRLKR